MAPEAQIAVPARGLWYLNVHHATFIHMIMRRYRLFEGTKYSVQST